MYTEEELAELQYSEEYADYIMKHFDGTRLIPNGHCLLDAMEEGYLFDDFLKSIEHV